MKNQTTYNDYGFNIDNDYDDEYSPERKRRYRLLIGVLIAFCVILTISIIVNAIPDSSNDVDADDPQYVIEYVYHTVSVGESISYIAEKYIGDYPGSFEEYQSLILGVNSISNPNRIWVGDVIKVPIYKEVVTFTN